MRHTFAVVLMILGTLNLVAGCLTPNVVLGGQAGDHRHVREAYARLVEEGRILEQHPESLDERSARARNIGALVPPQSDIGFALLLWFFAQGVVLCVSGWLLLPVREQQLESK